MESFRDLSQQYITTNPDLLKVEKPIPYNEFLHHSKARDKGLEYMILKRITETKSHAEFLIDSPENNSYNRYHDILPFRDTIVHLSTGQYINANYISVPSNESCRLIATQGPLSNTCEAFWRMVWEQDVNFIIMCCNFTENDIPKCYEYINFCETVTFGEFQIEVVKVKQKYASTFKRSVKISNLVSEESKKIIHIHLLGWEDNSVPHIRSDFNAINYIVFMIQHKFKKHSGKTLIHCSAGIGRTGVLVSLYELVNSLENQLNNTQQTPSISVFGTVRKIREQRWGMVNTQEQYQFIYSFMEYWTAALIFSKEN